MPSFDVNRLPQTEEEIDFTDIEEKYQVPFEEGFDTIIVVDNAPVVDQSREAKLFSFIRKIFKNVGEIKENGILMQTESDPETGKTKSKGLVDSHLIILNLFFI